MPKKAVHRETDCDAASEGYRLGKLVAPDRRRQAVEWVRIKRTDARVSLCRWYKNPAETFSRGVSHPCKLTAKKFELVSFRS